MGSAGRNGRPFRRATTGRAMRRGTRSLRRRESGNSTSVWQQLRAAVARRIRYKVTRGGVLFTFAILVVGLGAIISANNLLFLIVATMLATLLVSGLVSRLCLAGLELDFQVPDHVPARRPV